MHSTINKLLAFLLLFFFIGHFSAIAQKDKRKKSSESSRSDMAKAEYYFIEGEKYFILDDYAKSFVLFQKSLEYNDENAASYYKLADILTKGGELDKALGYAQKALELDPDNKYYYLKNAEIYTKKSNFSEAAAIYESMLANIPNTEPYLFDLAALYIYNDNYEKAIEIYNKAEGEFGVNQDITKQKQKIYLKQNRLDEAIAEGKKLIEEYPDEAEFKIQLAEILISNNRSEEALGYLEELLEEAPDNAHGRLMLAEIYRQNGEIKKAEENLTVAFANPELDINPKLKLMVNYINRLPDPQIKQSSLRLANNIISAHPENANAYAIYGDLLMAMDSAEAARDKYLNAVRIDDSNFSIWQNILDIELKLNELDSVIVHADQALELFPNQSAIYYFGGTAKYLKKNYEEAVVDLEQGKKLASSNLELLSYFNSLLGDSYNSLELYEKSDAAYEAVLNYDPENSHVLNNYSYFLSLRKDKLDKARKMSSKLVEQHPDDATFLDTHAWVLFMQGDYKEAKKILERALKGETNGTIIEHYGDVLFKLGETEKAVEQWKKAKGMNETSDLIDKKIADRRLYEE